MSNRQRALWTFLFFTLVGPFFGALVAVAGAPFLIWANIGPFMAGDHPPYDWSNLPSGGTLMPFLGQIAILTYIWCALPAALTGASLVPHVLRKGTVGWIEAAVGSALCLAASVVVLRFQHGGLLAYMCFAAALAGLLIWFVLRRAGVLTASATQGSPGQGKS
ncbi:MAG TPA: hypothetical protein VMX97_10600 [Hyphomicrobiaceae bacterium]|nr:hypothetical protein [Hyphomicrobiaceae bacterium]